MTDLPKPGPRTERPRRGLGTVAIVFGGLFLAFFLFAALALASFGEGFDLEDNRIAVVEVLGPITDSKSATKHLRKFARDKSVKGIVVRVDSPGGSVAPSQEIMQAIKAASKQKPLAVSMGSTAASGGYYVALGAPKIFANAGTVTGSIGVITQLFDVHEILDTVDVDVHTIKTGAYKDSGSPFREMTIEDEVHFRQLISDIYDQFVEDIVSARGLEDDVVRDLADGRVFTGRQAKELALIDEIGSLQDAVDWVASESKLEGEPKLVYPAKPTSLMDDLIRGGVRSFVGEARESVTPVVEYRYVGPQ